MRVGVFHGPGYAGRMAEYVASLLEKAGHTVVSLFEPSEVAEVQAVVLGTGDVPALVEQVKGHIRPHHIVMHVLPGQSLEPLAPLCGAGAVVGSVVPVWETRWAVEYTDEVSQTVLELLVRECGAEAVLVPASKRALLATGLSWLRFAEDVGAEAYGALSAALEDTNLGDGLRRERRTMRVLADVPVLEQQRAGIVDPGKARIFRQLARRAAEQDGREEVELWAMQEEER
ncbi:hypothetical protein Clow_01548 [Corynebacterium lowii]|uniref:CGL2689-like C-terminal domain-containing protein n=2 Tax=Corynebacterium lowii TaxID=1544413 RepID=A0A0N8W0B0_9CORY|nr:hypothetical protein Clow_01548 [Corynebacterium lowii]